MGSNTGPTDLQSPSSPSGALIRRYVPAVQWMGDYRSSWFKADAIAAISVWALLVPQALAYSSIAGVPPEYGLYAAFAALVAYGLFGTSRQLVQGPSAAVAAVSAAVVTPLVGASAMGTEDAVPMTAALAIVTGIVYLVFGVFRLGWVSNFLSKAVISGFILGLSIGIIIDQSHKLLGVAAVDGSYWDILVGTIEEIPDTDATTLAVGATALLALLLMRRFAPRLPRALIVMVTSIVVVTAFDLASEGVAVTGEVPLGLFTVAVPFGSFNENGALIVGALSIIFVGYSETLASGREMAAKHGYEIDSDQELIAEGVACAGAGLIGAYVTDGSLSKTSVADAAGQKTQMAALINSVFILLTVLFLAALFENLADAVLGAVVIDAMVGLLSLAGFKRYYRVNRTDWMAFVAAGLGILFFSITAGIAIGVVLSLLVLIARASRPALHRLGRDAQSGAYLAVERHTEVVVDPRAVVARLDGPLFFANANVFRDGIHALLAEDDEPPLVLVVDMEAVSQTDTDGADILSDLAVDLQARGIWFGLARVEGAIRDRWQAAGAIDAIGRDHVHPSVAAAVDAGLSAGAGTSGGPPAGS